MKSPTLATVVGWLALTTTVTARPVTNIGPGQTVTDPSFNDEIVNLNGGTIISNGLFGAGGSITDGVLNINSGSITDGFTSFNSIINLNGGTLGEFIANEENIITGEVGEINISGGSIGSFGLFDGVTSTITGGQVLRFPDVFAGSTVNIFGGDLFSVRLVNPTATANFFGSQFALNGTPIEIALGQTLNVTPATGENFTATLADGSAFEFDLNPVGPFGGTNPDQTSPGSIITITLTPINGDFNADGLVNAADFTVARDLLGITTVAPFAGGDGDGDQLVTAADIAIFAERFGETEGPSSAASTALSTLGVPEPTSGALLLLGMLVGNSRRRRQ